MLVVNSISPKIRQIFSNIRFNKKEFHKCKEPIELMSVIKDQIAVSAILSRITKVFDWLPKR